jgi:prophage regulatory protein
MLDTITRNRLLRLPEVRERTGKSRSAIYREIRAGSFPRQLALGPRTAAWSEAEVSEWIAGRIRARDGSRA